MRLPLNLGVISLLVNLPTAKTYLRIDTDSEDDIVKKLLRAAEQICMNVARMDESEFKTFGNIAKTAVLYALAYLYEHREEADHHDLMISLRNLLTGVRKEGF